MTAALSDAEREEMQTRLWEMLSIQAERYTMGESTSLQKETATALLESVRLSVDLLMQDEGVSLRTLMRESPNVLLRRGAESVSRRVSRARLLFRRAERCVFQEESLSLQDTLHSIGGFFSAYDPHFFAADVPCDIDYQLTVPAAEDLRGVVYLQEYLRHLVTEDTFLRCFTPKAVRDILEAAAPDHRELLVNLYEPVACAALGVTLVEGNLFSVNMTAVGQRQLSDLLKPLHKGQRREKLIVAAGSLAARLNLGAGGREYLHRTAMGLAPRVEAVLDAGTGWQALFPAL